MHSATDSRDWRKVRDRAHFLKGSMAQLGLQRMNRICLTLQLYIDKTPMNQITPEHIEGLLHQLDLGIRDTQEYMYASTSTRDKLHDRIIVQLKGA